jgi:hypothetical protein
MSFAIIGVATAVAGTVITVAGQRQAANAAQDTANYNADLALEQARHENEVAAENARRKARENAKIIGLQREAIAVSGLAPAGTPLAILGETVSTLERDILDMGYEAAARARQLQSSAAMSRWEGSATASAATTAMVGTAISGVSSAGKGYFKAKGEI